MADMVPLNVFIKSSKLLDSFFLSKTKFCQLQNFVTGKDCKDLSDCSFFLNYGFPIKFCAGDKRTSIISISWRCLGGGTSQPQKRESWRRVHEIQEAKQGSVHRNVHADCGGMQVISLEPL